MKNNKEYKFKVGDKAELDLGFGFMKGDCMMYIERGAEVTVTKVFGEVCEVEYEGAVSLINSYYLTLIEPKDKPKFKEGDKVRCHALGGDEYFDGVVVSYNNEYGAKCYGVLNENTHTIANVDFEHCVELIDEQSKVEAKFKVGDRVQILKDGTFQADNKDTVHLCKGSVVTISELAEYAAKQFKNLYFDFCHREER